MTPRELALADLRQWPRLAVDPGLTTVLSALDHAADVERKIGNLEARAHVWQSIRAGYWSDIARTFDLIAPAVCALMPGWQYDPDWPTFWGDDEGMIPPCVVRQRVRERIGAV